MNFKYKRNITIDLLRGIAVIAVLMGHSLQRGLLIGYENNILFKFISAWHMPLFFFLAGMTLYYSKSDFNIETIQKKTKQLVIPVFVWSIIIYLIKDFDFVGITPFRDFPKSFFSYIVLLLKKPIYIVWFLYVLFLFTMLLLFLKKYVHNQKYFFIILLIIWLVGFKAPNLIGGELFFHVFSILLHRLYYYTKRFSKKNNSIYYYVFSRDYTM